MIFLLMLFGFSANAIYKLMLMRKFPKRGNDSYLYLLYTIFLKKQKKLPVIFDDLYALEYNEMWYPPGLPVILSILPTKFIQKYYWLISIIFDSLIVLFLSGTVYVLSNSEFLTVLSAFIYIFSFSTINEVNVLTPRIPGLFYFNLLMVSYFYFIMTNNYYLFAFSLLLGVLVLLTHKMTTQIIFLTFIMFAFILDKFHLIYIPSVIFLTIIFSKGFYIKILKSHYDYIQFWSRKWKKMGGHQIKDSPIYGDIDKSDRLVYQDNFRSYTKYIFNLIFQNQYIIYPIIFFINNKKNDGLSFYYLSALTACIIFSQAILVYALPFLRGIGYGGQYGKYTAFFSIIIIPSIWCINIVKILIIINILILTIIAIKFLIKSQREVLYHWDYRKMTPLFNFIKILKPDLLWCIPVGLSEPIAYECYQRVLWGAHGSPTKNIEFILPVLSKPIEEVVEIWNPSHILFEKAYTNLYKKLKFSIIWENDDYIILKSSNSKNR